jgi:hypothetical protein
MVVEQEQKIKNKKEIVYLESKEDIKSFVVLHGYEHIIKYMLEDLDQIDDINNTQSVYLFQLISALENVLEIYPRLKNV